jgi:hypothetical protein
MDKLIENLMLIEINYDSKWGNSFLGDEDAKGKRPYIASSARMNDGKNKNNALDLYKEREISLSTVHGVLYRLLGARHSLRHLRENDESILSSLINEDMISFKIRDEVKWEELVFLRNNSGSTDQNSYSGIPNESLLEVNDIKKVFNVLYYNREQLMDFVISDQKSVVETPILSIVEIANRLQEIYKDGEFKITEDEFDKVNSATKASLGKPCHAKANLALLAINKAMISFVDKSDLKSEFLTSNNTLSGISMNGNSFTLKDFMKKFANPKIVYGNPYKTDFWVDNPVNGKLKKFNKCMTKSSGVLEIEISGDIESHIELKELIENAGVSSFYLGKKGLAYINNIII